MTEYRYTSLPARSLSLLHRRRDSLLLIGLLTLVLMGLAGLAAATGWQETLNELSKLGPGVMLLLLALSLANYGLRALRWHLFTVELGLPTTLQQNLRHYLGGFAMAVTPGRVGELVRMRWIHRETGWPFERSAPLALVDRAADLAAMGLIMAVALSFGVMGARGGLPVSVLALLVAWLVTRPRLLAALTTSSFRLVGRSARMFVRLRRASRSLEAFKSPKVLTIAMLLGLVGWLAEGVAFHALLVVMGTNMPMAQAVGIFIFSTLAGGLTGAPGGLGGAEAAMIALLTLDGVPAETAIAATAVIRVTTLWFAILIGVVAFPIAEKAAKAHALENH